MKIDINSSSTGNVSSGEISGLTSNNFTNAKNLSDLKPGDKFKAVVTDITPNQVTLKLASGSSLTAKSLILPEARIGEESIFAVKENFKGQILLEMVKPDNTVLQTNLVKEALKNASLATTKENIDLVVSLIKNGMPIDQETLHKAAFFNYSKAGIAVDQVLFLLKEGFSPSENNIKVLEGIMNKSLGLEKGLNDIISGVFELEAPELKRDLIDILLSQAPEEVPSVSPQKASGLVNSHNEGMVSQGIENGMANGEIIKISNNEYTLDSNIKNNISELIERLISSSPGERADAEKIIKDELNKLLFVDLKNDNGSERKELGKYFKELSQTVRQLSDRLQLELRSQGIISEHSLSAKNSADNPLGHSVDHSAQQVLRLDSSINNVAENMKFMNQIHNYKEYMQIPFSVNGERNQGELYIFKNAKGAENFNEQASVLIAVDFAALGRVECFVNKTRKSLSIDFKLEDDDILGLIKRNSGKLFDALSIRGYKIMGVTFKKIETEHKLTDDMSGHEKKVSDIRYAFDMRV